MVYCAIKGCKNDSKKTKNSSCGKISYFHLPKNQLWKEWVKFCGKPKMNLATARVCSIHFPKDAYREKAWVQQQYPELMRCEPRLKDDAVPSKFLASVFFKACTKLTSQGIIEINRNENSIVLLGQTNITSQLTSLEIQDSIPAGSSKSEDFIEDSNQLEHLLEKLERLKEDNENLKESLHEKVRLINEKDKVIHERNKIKNEKDKIINEKQKIIDEKEKILGKKEKLLEKKDKTLDVKEKVLSKSQRQEKKYKEILNRIFTPGQIKMLTNENKKQVKCGML